MGYVAIKGGETAIREAARLLEFQRAQGGGTPLSVDTIRDQLHFLTGRVISEGGLYDLDLAALALKQSAGDTLEAAFFLRAFRSTRARLAVTEVHDGAGMRLIRRISSAFKEIPGGQMLGPTPDYLQRLFRFEQLAEGGEAFRNLARDWLQDLPSPDLPDSFPKVVDALRAEGLLPAPPEATASAFDITREPLVFPVSRSAALATMSRAETGSMLAIAYSNMRGYGDVVPLGASLTPLRGTDSVMWTVKFRDGQMKRFKFSIRTTPWGSIEPHRDLPAPAVDDAKGAGLCGQAKYLGVERLPVIARS